MTEISRDGDMAIVKPGQDIVASIVDGLKEDVKKVMEEGATQVSMDLDGVNMMDSMGLGVLIAIHNSLQKQGNTLQLLNVASDILKLLKNMRLDQHFNIVT